MLEPFRSHGWTASIVQENDHHSSLEVGASKGTRTVRIGVLYSTGTDNRHYKDLEGRVEHIFFNGSAYKIESFACGVKVPVEPLDDFFPLLVALNKQLAPDRSPPAPIGAKPVVRRITEENPLHGVLARLEQFTSVNLARKLVERRAASADIAMTSTQLEQKASGLAYSMRNALDYVTFTPGDALNKRILGLYYGAIAFAFAEMLASPQGAPSLDAVESMTKQGHGLYTISTGDLSSLRVGVLATGFMPQWLDFLGHDTGSFPKRKPKTVEEVTELSSKHWCSLEDLFASMPEIEDLFSEVFSASPRWIVPSYDNELNVMPSLGSTHRRSDSTYAHFIDRSGKMIESDVAEAGWPLAELQLVEQGNADGNVFRARVDHGGRELWWHALPTHSSPFRHGTTLLLPTLGGMSEFRTIATATLYALSILVRYMPSAWRRVEGGDEDQYLALIKASLRVWERVLPEQFLQSIVGETILSGQPGGW